MTTRLPAAFIVNRSVTVSGRGSAFIGLQFRQLSAPKVSVGQLGMRNDKVRFRYPPLSKTNDVQVQRARAPALGSVSSLCLLDSLQGLKQLPGLEPGFQKNHLIEIGRLLLAAQRRGLLDGGSGDQSGIRQHCQSRPRCPQVVFPVAQVAAQRDVDLLRQGWLRPRRQSDSRSAGDRKRGRRARGWPAPARPARLRLLPPAWRGYRYRPGSWPSSLQPARSDR